MLFNTLAFEPPRGKTNNVVSDHRYLGLLFRFFKKLILVLFLKKTYTYIFFLHLAFLH